MKRVTAASESTIVRGGLYRRAETLFLFDRLEGFVNLEGTLGSFEAFLEQNQSFHPVEFYDALVAPQEERPVAWRAEFHDLFLTFRDMLREVWRQGTDSSLGILLGTEAREWGIIGRKCETNTLDKILSSHEVAIEEAMKAIPEGFFTVAR